MRLLRVSRLKANCDGSTVAGSAARSRTSTRLSCAAFWVRSTIGRRSPRSGRAPRRVSRVAARRERRRRGRSRPPCASLVPEPMEKCAVCAASPRSTTLSWCQRSLRTVTNWIHCERFDRAAAARRGAWRRASRGTRWSRRWSRRRGRCGAKVSSSHSTMKVLVCSSKRYACTWKIPCSRLGEAKVNASKSFGSCRARCSGTCARRSSGGSRRARWCARCERSPSAPSSRSHPAASSRDTLSGRRRRRRSSMVTPSSWARASEDVAAARAARCRRSRGRRSGRLSPRQCTSIGVPVGEAVGDRLVRRGVGLERGARASRRRRRRPSRRSRRGRYAR